MAWRADHVPGMVGRAGIFKLNDALQGAGIGCDVEQILLYRNVQYVIGPEQDGQRLWTVDFGGNLEYGMAGGNGMRGSFKTAVMAARDAIDAGLDQGGRP